MTNKKEEKRMQENQAGKLSKGRKKPLGAYHSKKDQYGKLQL